MGYVFMEGASGLGFVSDECTAERKHVLEGHSAVTSDSNDEAVNGTMPNNGTQNATLKCGEQFEIPQGYTDGGVVTAADLVSQTEATAVASDVRTGKTYWKDGAKNTGTLADKGAWSSSGLDAGASVVIPAGIHDGTGKVTAKSLADQTKGTLDAAKMVSGVKGYSNGKLVSGSMIDRGAYATGDKFGEGSTYYAICNIPDGWYHEMSGMESWSPEARLPKDKVREFLGVSAAKIIAGQSIAGIAGTGRSKVKQLGEECFYGFSGSDDSSSRGPYDESFTLPSDGVVYYSGGSASYSSRKTVTCEIYKNGSIVDSRNIDSSNDYVYRGTMTNKSFTVKKGDIVRVRVGTTASSHSTAFLFATIVYD